MNYVRLGTHYGGWWIEPDLLGSDSTVYSVGIGEDISFDLALIDMVGCTVHAFDPTPRSLRWLKSQVLPKEFVIHPYGIADHDGKAPFYPPANREWVSHSIFPIPNSVGPVVPVDFKRFPTVMQLLKHDRLDLLKMDIEGAEYGVLKEILRESLAVKQIAVELHAVSASDTSPLSMVHLLEVHGYTEFYREGTNHLFVRE